MPIVKYVAFNGKAVGQVCGKHSRGSPAVERPSIHLVISVRHPNGREMRPIIIGAVFIFAELEVIC